MDDKVEVTVEQVKEGVFIATVPYLDGKERRTAGGLGDTPERALMSLVGWFVEKMRDG